MFGLKMSKARSLIKLSEPNKGMRIKVNEGTCRLVGRHLDHAQTVKLDSFGRRKVGEHVQGQIDQHLIEFEREKPTLSLGSFKRGDDILIQDELVSQVHAMLFNEKGNLYLSDLGSTNGTYLNGERIGLNELTSGAVVTLGAAKYSVE